MKTYKNPSFSELNEILKRPTLKTETLNDLVSDVFSAVKRGGDEAVKRYVKLFDRSPANELFVKDEEFEFAKTKVNDELKKAIQVAKSNIEKFHKSQQYQEAVVETMDGIKCWRKSTAIEKVGLYIPGGTAPLFSTLLMLGIPAKLATCNEITICTPANENGEINPVILYTADLLGIKRIAKIGGIQAIAALTFGTESISPVYKIFGPGNQYVTAAKQRALQEGVAIDMPAGPSELMVVADESALPEFVAADLISQAEHGADSQVVLVTNSNKLIEEVKLEIEKQLIDLPRAEIAKKALENSKLIEIESNRYAEIINFYAPEHLILNTNSNDIILPKIINAGSVFIGQYTPESAGDYASGTNHTLPTNGFARAYSGVSLDSFVKKITFQEISKEGILNLGNTIEIMAEAEQLMAHKNAVSVRLNQIKNENN
jgi:histidinol dehydrogenase